MEFIKTWAPILVPLLGLVAGTGWLKYYLSARRAEREKYQSLLVDFLRPLQGVLIQTQALFGKLRDDRELSSLEYHPGRLQQHFASLADDDPRKMLWRAHIALLQEHNRRAVELIERHYGRIVLPEFRAVCDQFIQHAREWKVMWKALSEEGSVPAALSVSGTLMAPQFPADMETLLKLEMEAVEKRA
jgi:hypothetical protein